MNFVPNQNHVIPSQAPFFEDHKVAGGRVEKSVDYYQLKISSELRALGAIVTAIVDGKWIISDGSRRAEQNIRYGYRIAFSVQGVSGCIDCAALPLKSETALKKKTAICQALYLLGKELEAMRLSWVYKPGTFPLFQYLLDKEGRSIGEMIAAQTGLIGGAGVKFLPATTR